MPTDAARLREHRLYQVDFLMRKYGFSDSDILFDERGDLSLEADPKEVWAANHPEFFPVDVNRASRLELLRVPGSGAGDSQSPPAAAADARIGRLEEIGRGERSAAKGTTISGLLNILIAKGQPRSIIRRLDLGSARDGRAWGLA